MITHDEVRKELKSIYVIRGLPNTHWKMDNGDYYSGGSIYKYEGGNYIPITSNLKEAKRFSSRKTAQNKIDKILLMGCNNVGSLEVYEVEND